jgi:hypothetical protein
VSNPHLKPKTTFLLLLDSCGFCWRGAPSVTRGWVCILQLLLVLASADPRIFVSQEQEQCSPVVPPGIRFPFGRLLQLVWLQWKYSNTPPREETQPKTKSKLLYDWRFTANQFILAPSPLRLAAIYFFFCNWTLALIVLMQYPLWGEDGILCYEYVWPFFKCTYRTCSMLLKILPFALYTSPMVVQALQSRSCQSYISCATTAT